MEGMRKRGVFWAADSAVIVGDVRVGVDSSFWHHTVARGDVAPITVGARVSVQDGAVLHCKKGVPLEIGDDIVIGHQAVVHCKRVGSGSLIGIRATVLDDAEIGAGCLIAAGAVVPPGTIVPDGMLVIGLPGKVTRPLRDEEKAYIKRVVGTYLELARDHGAGKYKPVS